MCLEGFLRFIPLSFVRVAAQTCSAPASPVWGIVNAVREAEERQEGWSEDRMGGMGERGGKQGTNEKKNKGREGRKREGGMEGQGRKISKEGIRN